MDAEIRRLIEEAGTPFPLKSAVVIYGAGNTGRAVCAYLTSIGYRVSAFLDANATPGQQWEGVSVHKPTEWLQANKPERYEAVVAIHNYAVDMVPLLDDLRRMGFARVVNMVQYQNLFPNDRTFRYWLAPSAFYHPFLPKIEQLSAALDDDLSRAWLNAILTFRLSGDYARLPAAKPYDQYGPNDLPRWPNPMRFIDCGAFNGDTIEQFARRDGYRFDAIAAFEPEPKNFSELARRAAAHGPVVCFPCGVAGSTSLVRFQSGHGMGSRSSSDGDSAIQCVAIDEALGNFRPTLIKMDVEGAELGALHGARGVVAASRPGLAICVYHEPAHLWQVPLLIRDWNLGYRLYLRGHAHSGFDLVLYAIPESMV
jgi:FkbM family methyltransferase